MSNSTKYGFAAVVFILLPAALLINLGLMVFIDDEAIRALVAQEMLWSGNYVAPTMHADAYLNKPPGWNWVLALSFWLHGGASEWAARLPTVLGLVGFAATVYYFSRRHFPRYLAGLHALTVVTCGRMLFWDSMLALIDVTFSWVVYAQIMLLYEHGRAGRWWRAFGWSYALTAVAFMLKGLPAVVFQGLSVLAILGWTRSWRQFVRPAHLLTGLGCVAALAMYYWQYGQYVDLTAVAERLFQESSKRTAVAHGWWASVEHVLAFPFEMSYHFLPWTLLLAYLLQPGSWARLRTNDFAAFLLVAFLVNVPVYWLSPNVYPRYLLMLFPLLFGALLWLHRGHRARDTRTYRGLRYVLLAVMSVCAVALPFAPLVPEVAAVVKFPWLKSVVLGAGAGAVVVGAWRSGRDPLLWLAVFLLVLRVGFNGFVLPARAAGDEHGQAVRASAYRAMAGRGADTVGIFGFTLIEPATGYYLTEARGAVVPRVYEDFSPTARYIVSPLEYPEIAVVAVDSIYLRHLSRAKPDGVVHYPLGVLRDPPDYRVVWRSSLRDGMGSGVGAGGKE